MGYCMDFVHSIVLTEYLRLEQAFFLTPPTKKTKTQGQNSSKKLKKKTQPLGGTPLKFEKLKKITKFLFKKIWDGPKNAIF